MTLVDQFVTSLSNFEGYRKLAKLGFGKSFVFLLVFLVLVSFVCGLKVAATIDKLIDAAAVNLPDFVLIRGRLATIPNVPVEYRFGSQVLLIDTTGKTTPELFARTYGDGLFFGPEGLVVKSQSRIEMIAWSDLNPTQAAITRDDLLDILYAARPWRFLAIPLYFVAEFLVKLLHILILSVAAVVLNSIIGTRYEYPALWNISLYAMVPVTLLEVLKNVSGLLLPFWRVLYWTAAVALVAVVLTKLKKTAAEEEAAAGGAGPAGGEYFE